MQHELILLLKLRKFIELSIFLVCAIFSISCQKQTATSFEKINETSQIKEIPKDWQKIETDEFSFSIPSTMKKNNVRGIDSFVMQFENNEITLDIEYGDYSADVVSQLQNYEGKKEQTIIDGETVEIVNYDYNKPISSQTRMTNSAKSGTIEKVKKNFFIGVNFPNSMKSYHQSAISFEARINTLESRETAEKILKSIKFKQK